jgi:hypothetical protein
MKIINPITIDNDVLDSSNVTEDDHPEWASGTTYAAEDRVIVIGTTHKIYESAQGSNTGNDPVTDDGTWWIEVSATNRWKAFDNKLSDRVTNTGSIEYSFTAPSNVTGVAIFAPQGSSVNITVTDGSTEIYNEDFDIIDTSDITDWLEFFTTDLSNASIEALIVNIPGYTGNVIDVTISGATGSSTVRVGEIALGYVEVLGETEYGTQLSILDFSTKDTDTFGNFTIVERVFQNEVNFNFHLATTTAGKVKRKLAARRAKPTVYFADFITGPTDICLTTGSFAYGYYEDFDIPLTGPSLCFATLEARSLS